MIWLISTVFELVLPGLALWRAPGKDPDLKVENGIITIEHLQPDPGVKIRSFCQFRWVEQMPTPYKGSVLRESILEVVENQMRDNQPPETRQTFDRLRRAGLSQGEAKRLIGCALSVEIYEVLKNRAEFNRQRYSKNLGKLPQMPWES